MVRLESRTQANEPTRWMQTIGASAPKRDLQRLAMIMMMKTVMLLCLLAIATGCATPRDLRGTWRLDVPASKSYYESATWPHDVDDEWWKQGALSRLRFSGSTIIMKAGVFAAGDTNDPGVLHVERVPFTLNYARNGVYELTFFSEAYGEDVAMTLRVTGDHMEQTTSHDGIPMKYFWRRD